MGAYLARCVCPDPTYTPDQRSRRIYTTEIYRKSNKTRPVIQHTRHTSSQHIACYTSGTSVGMGASRHANVSTSQRRPSVPKHQIPLQVDNAVVKRGAEKKPMTTEELAELFTKIHHTMDHLKYAIYGLGAMIEHGLEYRSATSVAIMVPEESKHVTTRWLKSKGCDIGSEKSASILRIAMNNLDIREVRISYVGSFDRVDIVPSRLAPGARVVSLASQLEHIAETWVAQETRGRLANRYCARAIANDVFWCLNRARTLRAPLPRESLPCFLSSPFLASFSGRYPALRAAAARAGVDIAGTLDAHRMQDDLAAHNQLLAAYDARLMTVIDGDATPPRTFDDMTPLGDERAVRPRRSFYSTGSGEEGPFEPGLVASAVRTYESMPGTRRVPNYDPQRIRTRPAQGPSKFNEGSRPDATRRAQNRRVYAKLDMDVTFTRQIR